MKELNKDWITDGLIDFEYKKYILLAYLKGVRENFDDTRLYPFLSDLLEHYGDALSFQRRKNLMRTGFPKEISRIDLEHLKISYNQLIEDDELMLELERIVEYALPKMKDTLGLGKERYEEIESTLCIEPVGIMPLYKDEGYVMLEFGNDGVTSVYQYKVSKFILSGQDVRGIYFNLLDSVKRGIGDTLEGMKLKLIKLYEALPNPAAFFVRSPLYYPLQETALPITKRLLLQTLKSYQ